MRPDVVWFGETLPDTAWQQAESLASHRDCLLVIGTSASVYPAAGLIHLARPLPNSCYLCTLFW